MKTEIIKNQPFAVCVERSYVNCLLQGMRFGVENVSAVWRNIWPFFLFSLFLPFPFSLLLIAAIAAQMPKWSEVGYIPRLTLSAQGASLRKAISRFLVYIGLYIGLTTVSLAVLFALVYVGLPFWAASVFAVVVFLLMLPFEWTKMELLYGDAKVGKCIAAYKVGVKNYMKLFPFYMLVGLVAALVLSVAAVPLIVSSLVIQQMSVAEAIGDPTYVPGYFWFLVFLSYTILPAVQFYVMVLITHAEYLLWGSITACGKTATESVEVVTADSETQR